jgi:hypothetical protein
MLLGRDEIFIRRITSPPRSGAPRCRLCRSSLHVATHHAAGRPRCRRPARSAGGGADRAPSPLASGLDFPGGVPEWLNGAASKAVDRVLPVRGFESHPLRLKPASKRGCVPTVATACRRGCRVKGGAERDPTEIHAASGQRTGTPNRTSAAGTGPNSARLLTGVERSSQETAKGLCDSLMTWEPSRGLGQVGEQIRRLTSVGAARTSRVARGRGEVGSSR